ncbi:MAG: glycoside hydrolase family 95 protein [Bacteroides sp.]|nr:glycoside hydrolase family 95 protein [Bacteroides sp.]
MKTLFGKYLIAAAWIAGCLASCALPDQSPDKAAQHDLIWFDEPAAQWEETLPVGNGRLGMMPDGGITQEKIVLNDISMWSGSVANYNNPEAARYLPRIRQLLFEGRNVEAQEVMYRHFVPVKPEKGGTYGNYQMLADLDIRYRYAGETPSGEDYFRYLDLKSGLAGTLFKGKSTHYIRRYFVSRDRDVMVVHLTTENSKRDKAISFQATLNRPERAQISIEGNMLVIEGILDSGKEGQDGVAYTCQMQVVTTGGTSSVSPEGIEVQNAEEATLILSAATDFFYPENYREQATRLLQEALAIPYQQLEEEYTENYRRLYDRASLSITAETRPEEKAPWELPTDQRILRFRQEEDPALAALYYNYGRYLLISTTRPGSLPPNLQGLWANECGTPWNGDYHLNINVQMNHWPVEPANLSELHLPLTELTRGLVENGEKTAKAFYGADAKGWVAHMMTNVWNFTAPGEHPSWGATNTGGAWLCAHLWEHYLYTGDPDYLREVYPVLKGAAAFFHSTMVEEPTHGWLVTAPSSSPENLFYIGNDPTPVSVCMGPTMDIQLVRELYTNVIEASKILGVDTEFRDQLAQACEKLPPHQISKEGYLMEWLEDYKEEDIHHRHVSHLYGLHPGNQITLTRTPELAEACRRTLERRGDGGTGWSRAWKINFWARLGDGNRAYKLFRNLMEPAYTPEHPHRHGSGTFPNLFCSHPPFQMDGNWGGTAGISEMLLQSHDGFIDFLPALPDAWPQGELKGFRVRGGATVDLTWNKGQAVAATIEAPVLKDRQTAEFTIKMPPGASKVTIKRQGKESEPAAEAYTKIVFAPGEQIDLTFHYEKGD